MSVLVGDCVALMAAMDAESVDAVVTDPPYGLEFMGKDWDAMGHGSAQQAWHSLWAAQAFRVLKPGGHLVAFGGSRTYHRMASAVEDAGFEIRDQLQWLYGQGFPKSHNLKDDREGWGTALKPAHEPIVLARKPLVGTVAANVLAHGTGALNIDGCRIKIESEADRDQMRVPEPIQHNDARGVYMSGTGVGRTGRIFEPGEGGRWPANVLLDDEAAAMLDQQSGPQKDGTAVRRNVGKSGGNFPFGGANPDMREDVSYAGSGGASRFFYTAKASTAERNAGLDGEFSLLREAAALPIQRAGAMAGNAGERPTRTAGDGTTPVEPVMARNNHPTVKPVALMRWLVRLVTPPGGLVLDPFAGSGTTGIAAHLEGFRFVGMEQNPEYAAIADARIAWWSQQGVFGG